MNAKPNEAVKRSPRTRAEQPLAVSIDEAAAIAGIGRGTLYAEIKAARGPVTFTIRGRRLVLVEELSRWLREIAEAQNSQRAA